MRLFKFLLVFAISVQPLFAKKLALIVAVGDYQATTGWGKISSVNDVPLIKDALKLQGFNEEDILVLINEQATKQGITEAFRALRAKAQPGDVVVIHFSSHGQQITDDNGDEVDGLDEALIPYDAWFNYNGKYKGENHLRDDEMGAFVTNFRNFLGKNGQLLMILDSCHSGTATRGSKVRGSSEVFTIPDSGATASGENQSASDMFELGGKLADGAAPFVLISGASAEEFNYEYKGFGSLSYAFLSAISDIDNTQPKLTYRQLFSKIKSKMNEIAKRQTPVIEGDIDWELFGSEKVEQQPYFEVKKINNSTVIDIQAGQIQGLYANTTINLLPKGTLKVSKDKIIAKGTVLSSKLNEATIKLETPLKTFSEHDYWVFVDERAFADVQLDVFVDKAVEASVKKEVENFMKEKSLGTVTDDEKLADVVVYSDKGDLLMTSSDGFELFKAQTNRGSQSIEKIKQELFSYAQGQFLKGLSMDNTDYKIEIRYVPVSFDVVKKKVTGNLKYEDYVDESGIFKVKEEVDYVQLEVKNVSNKPVYFNVLEINSKGALYPLMDACGKYTPEELKIEPGQTVQLCTFNFAPPYEKLVIKGFATDNPLDFSSLVTSRGESRGLGNPLEKFLANSYQQTRGPKAVEERPDVDGYTTEFIYEIVKH